MPKLDTYKPQSRNANRHRQRGMSMLEESIRRDGYLSPLTVAADGEAIDGSARLEVAADVFGTEVEPIIVRSDGTRPVIHVREDIPDAADPRAVRLSVAANRVAESNLEWDAEVLASLEAEGALAGLFTAEEVAELGAFNRPDYPGAPVDPNELWRGMPEFANEAEAARTLHVHFPTSDDCERFCQLLGLAVTEKTKTLWYPRPPDHERGVFVSDES